MSKMLDHQKIRMLLVAFFLFFVVGAWRLFYLLQNSVMMVDEASGQTLINAMQTSTSENVMLTVGAMLSLMLASLVLLLGLALLFDGKHKLLKKMCLQKEKMVLYDDLFGVLTEGVILVNAEGKIIFANASAHVILGNAERLIDKTVHQALPLQVILAFFRRDCWRVGECQVSISRIESGNTSMPVNQLTVEPRSAKYSLSNACPSKNRNDVQVVHFESCFVGEYYCLRCQDVTHVVEYENQLHMLKNFDLLTQVMTRRSLDLHIANAFLSGDLKGCLLYLGVDDFRAINMAKGCVVGDKVLQEIGRRLRAVTRKAGVVARAGGDEFVIFSETHQRINTIKIFAHQVLTALAEPIKVDDHCFRVNASVGIAMIPNDGDSSQQLMRCAEKAMQKAKRAGGAQFAEAESGSRSEEARFLELGKEIRHAIKHDEFTLRFQPIFELKHRTVKAFEALLRWEHKERGILTPASFLEHLENSRLIVELGFDVIRKSCRFITRVNLRSPRPLHVSVNLSPRQFLSRDLLPGLRDILMETECNPAWLEVEIPETALLRNTETAAEIIKKLRQLGVHISIDDFGTGYSSLDYLKKLDVDQLKIDKSFVSNAQLHNEDKAILEFTTFLAKKLNLSVVAEGVEVSDTDKLLQELGITTAQGYFYAKPMSEQKAEKFVALHSNAGNSRSKRLLQYGQLNGAGRDKVVRFPVRD